MNDTPHTPSYGSTNDLRSRACTLRARPHRFAQRLAHRWCYGLLVLILLLSGLVAQFSMATDASAEPTLNADQYLRRSLKGDSYSQSPLGYSGALRFLRMGEHPPTVVLDPRGRSFEAADVVFLLDPNLHHYMTPAQFDALNSYRESDATLVVTLPKRYGAQQTLTGQELLQTGLLSLGASAGVLRLIHGAGDLQRDKALAQPGPWGLEVDTPDLQTLYNVDDRWDVLVGDRSAAVVIRGERPNGAAIYIVSDADFFANHGLARADHAALLERLANKSVGADGQLYVDEAFHGYLQVYSPFRTGLSGIGLGLVLYSAFIALLLLWMTLLAPRRPWRALQVAQSTGNGLAQRTGDILRAHRTPVERLHKFRALLVKSALPAQVGASDLARQTRLEQLSELRQTTHSLSSLDQELHALPADASRRATQRLLRAYQQWYAEVTDATQ